MQNIRLLQPIRHADRRGFFSETWNKRDLIDMGITTDFVQDNYSISYEPERCAACIFNCRHMHRLNWCAVDVGVFLMLQ